MTALTTLIVKGSKMADGTLAGDWLKENGFSWDDRAAKKQRRKAKEKVLKFNTLAPVVYHPLDRISHQAKKMAQGRLRKYGPETTIDFVKWVLGRGRVRHECIFVPFAQNLSPATVNVFGENITAARYVCAQKNGPAPTPQHVARHLCGNGHLSCINPAHLAWGTVEDNANDTVLHRSRPYLMPDMTAEQIAAIKVDPRLPNVIAIEYQIPSAVIDVIQRGFV